MKLRTNEPWMPAPRYAASLRGLTVNLLVRDIDEALAFQASVLEAQVVYSDPDFAVCRREDGEWILHADHTYDDHPFAATCAGGRGGGVELRVHGCDPDRAEAAARRLGYTVVQTAADKGHGLREAFIRDADGYVWVPDVVLSGSLGPR